jgi:hypothetical protein
MTFLGTFSRWFAERGQLGQHDQINETTLRQSLTLPALINPLPDSARLNRVADEALRVVRREAARDAGFGWLLAPRVAIAMVAMLVLGSAAGISWPAASSTQTDEVALLDVPTAAPIGMTP